MKIYRVLFLLSLMSCASTINVAERNEKINSLVDGGVFEIKNEVATPVAGKSMMMVSDIIAPRDNATNLSLDRNDSYFKIKNDSISVYLPFFGERRILNYGHSATNHESFIVYTGVPQRLKSSFDKEKNEYRYDMRFKRNRESFRIRLTIQGNGSTRLFVSSTNRSSIFYLGKVKPLGDS